MLCIFDDRRKEMKVIIIELIQWIKNIIYKYQEVSFHLLGNMNQLVLSQCIKLHSCDSSAWIKKAAFGYPYHVVGKTREAKIQRATQNMIDERNRVY